LLAPLQAAGFADRQAGLAFSLLVDYTVGFAVSATPTAVNEQRVRDPAIRNPTPPVLPFAAPDRFPALVALGQHVWLDNRDQRFTAGLEVLVDGLEHARNSPSKTRSGDDPTSTRPTRRTTRRREDAQQAVAG
jgi:Tetracyclin repressor-like, C-terminal domain